YTINMIPTKNRFKGHGSIRYVYNKGAAYRSRFFVIKVIENKRRQDSRFSVVVSKKIFKSSVKRNRIRRRVYEYIQTLTPKLSGVYDVVITVSNPEVLLTDHQNITTQIDQLFLQAKIIKN